MEVFCHKSFCYTIDNIYSVTEYILSMVILSGWTHSHEFSLCQHDVSIYYSSRAASHNRSYNVYMYILLYILSHLLAGLLRKVYF